MKKLVSLLMIGTLSLSMLSGCAKTSETPVKSETGAASQAASESETVAEKPEAPDKKENVIYWAIHKAEEFATIEKAVNAFNAESDRYTVEALSVTDRQKLIVSMASSDGPDMIGATNQDLISYSTEGMIQPLDELISRDNFSLDIFSNSARKANTLNGSFYALPWHVTIIQMFYNKDILAEAGYTEPPTTMEDLYEIAIKATKTDAGGNIDIMGYPLFPLASNRFEGVYAFGGRWADDDGKPTPNTPEIKTAWEMNRAFREHFGLETVQKYVATSNTNRYTPEDAFFAGKQLFRFDGPWLNQMIKTNNPDLNYGIALVPSTSANPSNIGSTRFETQNSAITINAKNVDGAWELAKYFTVDAQKDLILGMGQLPASTLLYEDADIQAVAGFDLFIKALKADNGVPFQPMAEYAKYIALIDEAYDYMYNGTKTVDQALADLQKEADRLE